MRCTSSSADICALDCFPFLRVYSVSSTSTACRSPSRSITSSASFAVATPANAMPSGLSSERAAALSPFTNSRSTRCSSLMTRMRLTGLDMPSAYNRAMPDPAVVEFVIQGLTKDGKPFRPSDWAERLCGVMSAFGGDHRMQYSPFVHPVTASGVRCVVVDVRLEEIEPMAYRFLLSFAKENELKTRDGRIAERTELAQVL